MGDSTSQQHILVVDDEKEILEVISNFLKTTFPDAELVQVSNGVEAFEICEEKRFDLICTDQKMPYLTGTEFINSVRKNKENPNCETPVLFVSAYIYDVKEKIKSQKNIFYLGKPFNTSNLLLIVDKIMLENTIDMLGQNMELKRRHRDLAQKQGELIQSAKMSSYNEFSVSLAHELNNPLAVIEGLAYLLGNSNDPEKTKKYSSQILKNVERMKGLIKHLQKFTHISKGNLQEKVNLSGIIRDSLVFFHQRLSDRNIDSELNLGDDDLMLLGNEGLLTKVFHSLINNSIEAFDRNKVEGPKSISMTYLAGINQTLMISYEDNAGGIPVKIKSNIFDPFVSSKNQVNGVGLGLAVSYSILCKLGGSIKAESSEGQGSRFIISFPLSQLIKPGDSMETASPPLDDDFEDDSTLLPTQSRKKMLIVDDEEGICDLLESYFMDYFDVDATTDPGVAIRNIQDSDYDIVISDFKMPETDGITMINEMNLRKPGMVFVLISGHITDTRNLGFKGQRGQLGFISKPFGSPDVILKYVNELLDT